MFVNYLPHPVLRKFSSFSMSHCCCAGIPPYMQYLLKWRVWTRWSVSSRMLCCSLACWVSPLLFKMTNPWKLWQISPQPVWDPTCLFTCRWGDRDDQNGGTLWVRRSEHEAGPWTFTHWDDPRCESHVLLRPYNTISLWKWTNECMNFKHQGCYQ